MGKNLITWIPLYYMYIVKYGNMNHDFLTLCYLQEGIQVFFYRYMYIFSFFTLIYRRYQYQIPICLNTYDNNHDIPLSESNYLFECVFSFC